MQPVRDSSNDERSVIPATNTNHKERCKTIVRNGKEPNPTDPG